MLWSVFFWVLWQRFEIIEWAEDIENQDKSSTGISPGIIELRARPAVWITLSRMGLSISYFCVGFLFYFSSTSSFFSSIIRVIRRLHSTRAFLVSFLYDGELRVRIRSWQARVRCLSGTVKHQGPFFYPPLLRFLRIEAYLKR